MRPFKIFNPMLNWIFYDGCGAEFDEDSESGLGLMIGAQIFEL